MKTNITTSTILLPIWLPESRAVFFASESERHWLTDKSSLTIKLERFYNAKISINVLQQTVDTPNETELLALGMTADNQQFIVRRVQLIVDTTPRVYARSIFPSNMQYLQERISLSAQTPIGKWLFSHPEIERSTFEITRVNSKQLEVDSGAPAEQKLWGRRSVFSIKNTCALVAEYFLTPI